MNNAWGNEEFIMVLYLHFSRFPFVLPRRRTCTFQCRLHLGFSVVGAEVTFRKSLFCLFIRILMLGVTFGYIPDRRIIGFRVSNLPHCMFFWTVRGHWSIHDKTHIDTRRRCERNRKRDLNPDPSCHHVDHLTRKSGVRIRKRSSGTRRMDGDFAVRRSWVWSPGGIIWTRPCPSWSTVQNLH